MSRPTVEVADILRAQGDRFLERYQRNLDYQQLKAFRAIHGGVGRPHRCLSEVRSPGHLL